MFATTYPGGAGAMCAGIAWFVVASSSAFAVVVSLALSPFTRTASLARRLSQVALWGGLIAVMLLVIATAFVAVDRDVEFGSAAYQHRLRESLLPALLTALIPLAAFGARFWSCRTERSKNING